MVTPQPNYGYLQGTIWDPVTDRDANGVYTGIGTKGTKIVIWTTGSYSKPSWSDPPHFTIDPRSGGKIWQHVTMERPAYALKGGEVEGDYKSANRDSGLTIQVAIIGSADAWATQHYHNIAWWLSAIATDNGVRPVMGNFRATSSEPDAYRMDWAGFTQSDGIFGKEHVPFDTGNWNPGTLDTERLLTSLYRLSFERQYTQPPRVKTSSILVQDGSAQNNEELLPNSPVVQPSVTNTAVTDGVSMSGKQFRFNPPLHNLSIPVRVDFSSKNHKPALENYFDERQVAAGNKNPESLKGLRLGRIIQHELAAGMAATNPQRMGFRFLYNPTSVTISSSRNDSVILDRQSMVNAAISGIDQNFQVISFTLLLNRLPDVMSPKVTTADYLPNIMEEDLAGIRKYGTHWDLEILYRVCNGVFTLKDRGRTSDIGMIIPSNARLMLGPGQNHFGFVQSVEYTDLMFSRDMVPVRTEVTITFRRHVDMAPEDMDTFSMLLGQGTASSIVYKPRLQLSDSKEVSDFMKAVQGGFLAGLGNLLNYVVEGVGGVIGDVVDFVTPGENPAANTPGSVKDAPVPGGKITCEYYRRCPPGNPWSCGHHTGEDYRAPYNTPVRTTKAGVVIFAGTGNRPGWGTPYGVHVVIESEGIRHLYAHLTKATVSKGQNVAAGSLIGTSGDTGARGVPHLHYEERKSPYQYNVDCRKPIWGNGSG